MTKTCESSDQEKSSEKAKSFASPSSEIPSKTSATSLVRTASRSRQLFSPLIQQEIVRVDDIIKPTSDTRQYRGLVLPNELRVLLISDPETDKAAAGMSVQVGSMTDPWERQGLAHLLEHVLFLSTQKYPEDNFLKSFVSDHSGSCNAQTLPTDTVYYFDVAPTALGEVLLRFADLFTTPRFPADKVDRELSAIDFEFQAGLADDEVRAERVRQLCGDQKHIYSKFSYGNRSTLSKNSEQLLADVVNLFNSHYSPGAMGLAVLGKQSLEELEAMVIPAFSQLPNRGLGSPPLISTHPYSLEHCRQMIKVVPFKAYRCLVLFFPIPPTIAVNALDYVIWLLAHEGPGGLLAELKRLGYCSTIKVHSPYHHGFGFLNIELDLTQGITKNKEIITVVFQYLKLLREQSHKETYDEMKAIRDIKFHYRDTVEPMTYVYNLCFNLHISFQRCVLGRAFPSFLKEEVDFVLQLLTPNSLNIQVISPVFWEMAKQTHSGFTTDPLYGIQYSAGPVKPELLTAWSMVEPNPHLHMPPKNSLIPRDFTLKSESKQQQNSLKSILTPVCISSSKNRVQVWHLTDSSSYRAPKAFIGLLFRNGQMHSSSLHLDLTTLFINLYTEHANQTFFSGHLAGASYRLSADHRFGLELTVTGFNDHLQTYVLMLLKELLTFNIAYDRFDINHGTLENELKAFSTYTARYQLNYLLKSVLCSGGGWSYEDQAKEMTKVTPETMLLFLSHILENSQVEMLTYGNLTRDEALAQGQEVETLLWPKKSSKVPPNSLPLLNTMYDAYRDIKLPTNAVYELLVPNDRLESGHGTLLYYQIGLEDDYLKARLELFYQLIYFACFDQLRQKEQLAYVLSLSLKYTDSGTMGLFAFLQSSYPLPYIAARIDAFMNDTVPALLESTSFEGLERAKVSLISRLEEKPNKLQAMGERLWAEITCGQIRFDRTQKLVEAVKEIKQPKEMMDFYKEYFKSGGPKCRRLLITLKTSKCKELPTPNETTKTTPSLEVIKRITFSDVNKLKSFTEYWPLPALFQDSFQQ